jgi:hypothetical protein
VVVDEFRDGEWFEAEEMSPFHVRDPSLEYESPDVAHGDTEVLRNLLNRQQILCCVGGALVH